MMMKFNRNMTWVLAAAVTVGLGSPRTAAQSNLVKRYQLIELEAPDGGGESRAYAINDSGQIAGWVADGELIHSAHWHNRVTTDLHGVVHFEMLHPLFDQDYSLAYAISNSGQIVGTARTTIECPETSFIVTHAFLLRPAVLTDLATPYPGDALANLMTLGDPCELAYDSVATGVSNINHIVGWADREDGVIHGFLVTPVDGQFFADLDADSVNDFMIDLGTLTASDPVSSATDVNDTGQVTGYSYTIGADGLAAYHAYLITPRDSDADGVGDDWYVGGANGVNALMVDLGTLGGTNSWGRAISNAGVVIGESDMITTDGESYTHAFIWSGGRMTDLGTLGTDSAEGFSSASGINDDGVIVGWAEDDDSERRAFIYEDGEMQDLNDLLYLISDEGFAVTPSIVLTEARDINDNGVIVGWGEVRGSDTTRGFLLNPIMVDPDELETDDTDSTTSDSVNAGGTGNEFAGDEIVGTPGSLSATNTGDTGDTTTTPAASALCGAGFVSMVPLTLLGLLCLRTPVRRR